MRTRATLMVTGARVWTDGVILPDADALAIDRTQVLAVGRTADLEPLVGPDTVRIDARGGTVTPGLTDAHIHLVGWARALGEVALAGAASPAEAATRVAAFAAAHPGAEPVVGRGWDANAWSEPPQRAALDRVSGDRPVLLHSRDFHALWVNSAALARAGVTRATPDPPGGRIERDAAGEPTGVVREHAVRAFAALEEQAFAGGDLERVRVASRELHARGVTAVHDFEGEDAWRMLHKVGSGPGPRVRVLMHLPHAGLDAALARGLTSGHADHAFFHVGAVKLFADGTLGSRTAAMLEPYDGTSERGMDLIPPRELAADVARALTGGLSVAIHAIGDRAVRSSLDAFAAAGDRVKRVALPPRIEHAQLVHPDDVPRFAALGVAASMQPTHCTSDMDLVARAWRTRADSSYPWRSLLASGAALAFGSDAPVEPPDVAAGLHAAVTRTRADGSPAGGFTPAQRLTLDEALTAYTAAPARLAGWWPWYGRLREGSAADLVVWDSDLHALPPARLHAARPVITVVDGEIVFGDVAGGRVERPRGEAAETR